MPKGLPEDIAAEIAGKRTPSSEDQPNNGDDTKKDEKAKADESKKDDAKKAEKPEPKKGEAAKPKNGQSIAQVAEAANDDEDEDDDSDDEDDHDGDDHKSKKNRGSLFKEFIGIKRELKDQQKMNKETTKQYQELASAMTDLIDVVKDLKGNKTAQKDEIEEFAEEWGLDKEGTKKLLSVLEKRLSTKFKPTKDDDGDDEDEEPKKKVKKSDDSKAELNARKIELAIEGEYEDFIDSFPQLKGKLNLKAIKRYIIGDDENLAKSFNDIVTEMYPGILTGKAGVDGGTDGGTGADDEDETNFNDPKVLAQLDKNPKLKEKYHEDLVNRVKSLRR
jgi:hypothetical protein